MSCKVILPHTLGELRDALTNKTNHPYRFCAGGTDVLMEMKKNVSAVSTLINLGLFEEKAFHSVEKSDKGIRIGALTTIAEIIENGTINSEYQVLHEAATSLASAQIRNIATVAGNLCTASPSGDVAAALTALQATVEIVNFFGDVHTLNICDFITGLRKTALRENEMVQSIFINNNSTKKLFSGFIKVGTRRSMECAVVSLAYHLQIDTVGNVSQAGVALGSVASTILFAKDACDFLKGKSFPLEEYKNAFAEKIVSIATPISDVRASAWYRKEVLFNISKGLFE